MMHSPNVNVPVVNFQAHFGNKAYSVSAMCLCHYNRLKLFFYVAYFMIMRKVADFNSYFCKYMETIRNLL